MDRQHLKAHVVENVIITCREIKKIIWEGNVKLQLLKWGISNSCNAVKRPSRLPIFVRMAV